MTFNKYDIPSARSSPDIPVAKAEIMAIPIAGNALGDHSIFNAVDRYVLNRANSIEDRAEVLWWMGREVMGLTPEENDEDMSADQIVAQYVFFATDNGEILDTEGGTCD